MRPGSTNPFGYYRLARPGEALVGLAGAKNPADHDAYVVHLGVQNIQRMCGIAEKQVDGIFGPILDKAVRELQMASRLTPDGLVGPATMKAGLTPLITELAQENNLPVNILGGLLANESNLDSAAVGDNGFDHGVAQYNLEAHVRITVEQAIDVEWAIMQAAEDLDATRTKWKLRAAPGVDALDVAIAAHNSPRLAQIWARSGSAPYVAGRAFQIAEYVQRVKDAW